MEETSDQSIQRILGTYNIGRKIRLLRMKKKIALVDLGKHTGLSASMLSQLENGKLNPTLATLARIAMVFDVGLDHFFSESREKLIAIDRAGSRMRFPDRRDKPNPSYFFECLGFDAMNKNMQAYVAEFPKRLDPFDEHVHDGGELIYVVRGVLALLFQEEEYVLHAGDSAYFDSSKPHAYRGADAAGTQALVVTTAPRSI